MAFDLVSKFIGLNVLSLQYLGIIYEQIWPKMRRVTICGLKNAVCGLCGLRKMRVKPRIRGPGFNSFLSLVFRRRVAALAPPLSPSLPRRWRSSSVRSRR